MTHSQLLTEAIRRIDELREENGKLREQITALQEKIKRLKKPG